MGVPKFIKHDNEPLFSNAMYCFRDFRMKPGVVLRKGNGPGIAAPGADRLLSTGVLYGS